MRWLLPPDTESAYLQAVMLGPCAPGDIDNVHP